MNLTTLLSFVCESVHLFIADILTRDTVIVVACKLIMHNVFCKSISIVEIAIFNVHTLVPRSQHTVVT
jgi:hypothetical protein